MAGLHEESRVAHDEVLHVVVAAQRGEGDGVEEADKMDEGVAEPAVLLCLLLWGFCVRKGDAVIVEDGADRLGELPGHLLQLAAPLPVPAVAQIVPAFSVLPCLATITASPWHEALREWGHRLAAVGHAAGKAKRWTTNLQWASSGP